jgi:hypothetical protein
MREFFVNVSAILGLTAAAYIVGAAMFLIVAKADVPAPQSIVIVACKVTDWTNRRPLPDNVHETARGWRDLELFVNSNQEYECKREVLDLVDGSLFGSKQPDELIPLDPNFGDWAQCVRVGVMQAADWNENHPGWGVVAVGCPTRIVNDKGETVGWQMPSCPTYLPGTDNRMRCDFSDSVI